jgi:hypothetical protein
VHRLHGPLSCRCFKTSLRRSAPLQCSQGEGAAEVIGVDQGQRSPQSTQRDSQGPRSLTGEKPERLKLKLRVCKSFLPLPLHDPRWQNSPISILKSPG